MAIAADSCRVALLGRDDGARRQLRQALEDLGAAIAFEGEPAAVSGPAALGASLDVVIVSLEDGPDDALDHLQTVLDDPGINVVFNDADASRGLDGWDLARWARHLAAKVLGHGETMPPVPEGAERLGDAGAMIPTPGPVPTPSELAPEPDVAPFIFEAAGHSVAVPSDALTDVLVPHPEFESGAFAESGSELSSVVPEVSEDSPAAELAIDFDQLAGALGLADAPVPERIAPTPEPVAEEHLGVVVDTPTRMDEAAPESTGDSAPEAEPMDSTAGLGIEPAEDVFSLEAALGLVDAPAPELLSATPDAVDFAAVADAALVDPEIELALVAETAPVALEQAASGEDAEIPFAEETVEFSWEFEIPAEPVEFSTPGHEPEESIAASLPDAVPENASEWTEDSGLMALSVETADADIASEATEDWDLTSIEAASDSDAEFDVQAWSLDDGSTGLTQNSDDALDADVAALAAQLDAFEAPDSANAVEELDFSTFDAPPLEEVVPDAPAPAVASESPSAAPASGTSALELSLTPLDQEVQTPAAAPLAAAEKTQGYDFGNLDQFSLEPIEGEEVDPLMVAMGLVDAPVKAAGNATESTAPEACPLGHVFVLGASIGGPDAVRMFLSELPESMPAVFLLVQHLESGYFERLAQQLQKASALPVRIAAAGTPMKKGEVLVVPAAEHVVLEADGTIVASPHETPPHYTPSIDTVLVDVADRFGRNATAIIFSGMAGDAVEGAAYLTTKGGEVWVQDPQSCVVSSMVDGARARGVVEFIGSPRELAQRCVARVKR